MFTGIIETTALLKKVSREGDNLRLTLNTSIQNELKIDQSLSHNGVCLTVEKINVDDYEVVAIKETLSKSNLAGVRVGDELNLERCLKLNDRLDGHLVQGHVDTTASIISKNEVNGSWVFEFELAQPSPLIVEKGSICINGVSLTAFDVKKTVFKVSIIPYTYKHTNFKHLISSQPVNIEFDLIGKYIQRMRMLEKSL